MSYPVFEQLDPGGFSCTLFSVEGWLKSIINTIMVRKKPLEYREQSRKFPLNLELLHPIGTGNFASSEIITIQSFLLVMFLSYSVQQRILEVRVKSEKLISGHV